MLSLACFLDDDNKVVLKDVSTPRLSEGDILVKMEASGICGTDLEKIDGGLGKGGILGHEVSGRIEAVSKTVTEVDIGDRVATHHHVPCYNCAICRRGNFTLCDQFKKTNLDPCGFATYFRLPKFNVERGAAIPLPDTLTFEEGAMIEPTACCIRAIRRARVERTDNVLVIGLGPTGLTHLQLLREKTSGKIIGTDVIESRLEMARKLGIDQTLDPRSDKVPETVGRLTSGGADLALVATGNEKALDQAFASVRKGGRVLLFGAPYFGAFYRLDVSAVFARQSSLISSYSCTEAEMHEAIALVEQKRVDLRSLVTHKFALNDASNAFQQARTSKTAIKTIVTP